jgi:hypothetical protein
MLSNPKATLPTVAGSSESSEPLPIDESPTEELAPPRTFRRLPHHTRCEYEDQRVLAAGTGMWRLMYHLAFDGGAIRGGVA